jgi:hypothetical protein
VVFWEKESKNVQIAADTRCPKNVRTAAASAKAPNLHPILPKTDSGNIEERIENLWLQTINKRAA